MSITALSIILVCSFKLPFAREIYQNLIYTTCLHWENLKRKKKSFIVINHKIAKNSCFITFYSQSKKQTLKLWKTSEKWHFISQRKFRQSWTKVFGQSCTFGDNFTCLTSRLTPIQCWKVVLAISPDFHEKCNATNCLCFTNEIWQKTLLSF